ncbi:MAG: hypothetical protein JW751_17670 [Polyangiaceae bacterium]|nr:hypothetical protein [Polyangiaceae bacterium]
MTGSPDATGNERCIVLTTGRQPFVTLGLLLGVLPALWTIGMLLAPDTFVLFETDLNGSSPSTGASMVAGVALLGFVLLTVRTRRELSGRDPTILVGKLSVFGRTLSEYRRELGRPNAVTLQREIRGKGKLRCVVFPLSLELDGLAHEVHAGTGWRNARRAAEGAARMFAVPLRDHSSGGLVERTPSELDSPAITRITEEDLVTRPLRNDSALSVKALPRGAKELTVRPRLWATNVLLGELVPTVVLALAFGMLGLTGASKLAIVILGGLLLPVTLLPALTRISQSGLLRQRIHVNQEELAVAGTYGYRIPTSALEEVVIIEGPLGTSHVHVASDRIACKLGVGLGVDELEHLRAALLSGLSGRELVIRDA